MAQSTDWSSNKVTVEYSDPSGVFSLISSDLLARLPLRTLHWNSSSRPLRSIDSLHVELLPDNKRSSQVQSPPASSVDSANSISGGATPSINDSLDGEGTPKGEPLAPSKAVESGRNTTIEWKCERRHQIPGLRRTPYLKIYLLRCDDSETYKGSSRKLLREWVKEHTPPSQNSASINTQENHDAFEWLIIHVVVPNTAAADQSRPSASVKSEDGTERATSSSRWHGRSSASILDKIRSDFNGTSKSAVDRVAQVHVTKPLVPGSATTNTARSSTNNGLGDTKVGEIGWEDLVVKMKSLILASFDLRVRQYEEDIRERDSQRNLPGWNFCTFFVLKEGLARGFESVGLIEDALMGYDELAVGLDLIIREQGTTQSGVVHRGLFLDHTPELTQQVKQALEEGRPPRSNEHGSGDTVPEGGQQSGHSHVSLGTFLLNTDRKPYRELILGNNISAFEFQCYVFARQVSLLLRQARASSSNQAARAKPSGEKQPEDLLIIADVCRRATDFITSAARMIREDINYSSRHDGQIKEIRDQLTAKAYNSTTENLIAAWIFSAAHQMLLCTTTKSVADTTYSESQETRPPSGEASQRDRPKDLAVGALSIRQDSLPAKISPLSLSTTQITVIPNPEKVSSDGPFGPRKPMATGPTRNGIEGVAAHRASLCLLGRRALSSVGARHGWRTGWAEIASESLAMGAGLDEVSLDESETRYVEEPVPEESDSSSARLCGLNDETLRTAFRSKAEFYAQYKTMTTSALQQYHLGKRPKTAEALKADMAALHFYLEDYAGAVSLFYQMAPIYAESSWSFLETTMLQMHAQCLKKLKKTEDYIHMVLKILAKWLGRRKQLSLGDGRPAFRGAALDQNEHELGNVGSQGYLEDLLLSSRDLKQHISVPLSNYFGPVSVDPYVQHYADRDGFQLQLRLQYLLPESMQAQQVRLRLVSHGEGQQRDIWLAADEPQVMEAGSIKVMVGSKLLVPGAYKVDKVEIISENINFHHDSLPMSSVSSLVGPGDSVVKEKSQSSCILVWSKPSALEARMSLCKCIYLEKPKSIEIKISTGRNDITKGELLLRAASAGLRLDTADALIVDNSTPITEQAQPGVVAFGEVPAGSDLTLRIPYRLENDLNEISVKVEVSYSTSKGEFIYACNPTISVALPLGVNVQDIFKKRALFSRFTVNAATPIPLRLLGCELEGSRDLEAFSPPLGEAGIDIFGRQPASLLYKISRKGRSGSPQEEHKMQTKLSMQLTYQCLDDEIFTAVDTAFSAALKDSPFQDLSRLLVLALLTTLRTRLTVQDLEAVGMLREVDVGTFNLSQWDRTLSGLRPELRGKLVTWLMGWHEKHSLILLPDAIDLHSCRRITIPVEIPQMHVVHTADLRLHLGTDETSARPTLAALGQVVPATLTLRHTRKWDTNPSSTHDDPIEFYYEIHANPETWLIGGQKRTHYSAKENETRTFSVLLIPQRAGHLLLPSLEIRALAPQTRDSRQDASRLLAPISCETDYLNQAETMLVLPNMSSVTASLDSAGPAGGAWVVDSKPRVEMTTR